MGTTVDSAWRLVVTMLALAGAVTACVGSVPDASIVPTETATGVPSTSAGVDLDPTSTPTVPSALPTTTPAPDEGSASEPVAASNDESGSNDAGARTTRSRVFVATEPERWQVQTLDEPRATALRTRFAPPSGADYLVVEATTDGNVTMEGVEQIAATTIEPSAVSVTELSDRTLYSFTFTNNDGVPSVDVFTQVGTTSFGVVAGSVSNVDAAIELAITVAADVSPALGVPNDLGLDAQMRWPLCDGSWIVVIGSTYGDSVRSDTELLLSQHARSSYLRTDHTCPSLNPALNGRPIYAVYSGPYATLGAACEAKWATAESAYVRVLDQESDPATPITCPRPG